jgi:tetratricopeptide (TPR) repeat protein
MLTLEERAELLMRVAELAAQKANGELLALLSPLSLGDLISEPELGLRLALTHFHLSRFSDASVLVQQLAEPCRRRGFDQLYRRRLNLEANLLVEAGDPDRAEAAYLEVLDRSIAAGDQRWVAFATLNLSSIAGIRGEWMTAIAAAQRAIAAFQQIGEIFQIASCHQNLAMAYRELGLYARADSHFEQAAHLFAASGCDVAYRLSSLTAERAVSISASGDHRRAEAMVRHALDRLGPLSAEGYWLARDIGETIRVLGIVLMGQAKYSAARDCFERALRSAKDEKVRLLEGEVYEALSELAEREKKAGEAMRWATQAVQVYAGLGAHARIERIRKRQLNLAAG